MTLLQQKLGPSLGGIHKKRLKVVWDVVEALLCGHRLMPTRLGRALAGTSTVKSRIKRVDRLLGNWRFQSEIPQFFSAVATSLLGATPKPLILVDWTELGTGHEALVAAVPCEGRAIPIYAQVHPKPLSGQSRFELAFLRAIFAHVVPRGTYPIVVTDMGFKNPWFAEVERLGWDYVGRTSSNILLTPANESEDLPERGGWQSADSLWGKATSKPDNLGSHYQAITNPMKTQLVLYKGRPKGRRGSPKPNRKGVHAGSRGHQKAKKANRDPWLLCTSLKESEAKDIINIYRTRMQIEETFRDTKNHRFGWALKDVKSHSSDRLRAILLIAAIALLGRT